MKIEIKHSLTGSILFEGNFSCLAEAVETAVKNGANLDGARLDGASLDGARLDRASLDGTSLDGASLDRASLVGASLVGARLDGASLDRASLVGANLDGARLDGARLDGASLDRASLVGANLVGASLVGANLVGANLDGALHRYSQIAFTGHGECGRMLTAIQLKKDGPVNYFCGCFTGTEQQLRHYIENGPENLKKTRTLAFETSLILLSAKND